MLTLTVHLFWMIPQ